MNREAVRLIEDWPQYLTAAVLVMVRLSGLMVFAPIVLFGGDRSAHQGGVCVCDDGVAGAGCGGGAECAGDAWI